MEEALILLRKEKNTIKIKKVRKRKKNEKNNLITLCLMLFLTNLLIQ